jgi:hypothetical protein
MGHPEGVNNRSKGMKRSIDQREYTGGYDRPRDGE